MKKNENLPVTGGMTAPPADAPREVSQPLTPEAIAEMSAKARTNERTLAPLTFDVDPTAVPPETETVGEVEAPLPVVAAPMGPVVPSKYVEAVSKQDYPAASNTESPTRGAPGTVPVPSARKTAPLQPVGGFGEPENEYFPLDGRELKTVLEQLMDELHARLQNDLRFSIAVTYPRVRAKVQIVIEGEADDQGFTIDRVMPPYEKTPLAEAQRRGDSVVFVVAQVMQEFTEDGQVDTPPDGMRDKLGIPKPRKHRVQTGAGSSLVDVAW